MPLSITNDNGNTFSNSINIQVIRDLPTFKTLISPTTLYSNNKYDLSIEGANFATLEHIEIKIQ
jgi:hypothetical protein